MSSCSPRGVSRSSTWTTAGAPATAATIAAARGARGASPMSTTASPGPLPRRARRTSIRSALALRGGSASGYTTLCGPRVPRRRSRPASAYFGLGDLRAFAPRDPQVRVALSRPADRSAARGARPRTASGHRSLHTERIVGAGPRPPGRRGPDRPGEPRRSASSTRCSSAASRMPTCSSRARTTASAARPRSSAPYQAELSFLGEVFSFTPADDAAAAGAVVRPRPHPARPSARAQLSRVLAPTRPAQPMSPVALVFVLLLAATILAGLARRLGIPDPIRPRHRRVDPGRAARRAGGPARARCRVPPVPARRSCSARRYFTLDPRLQARNLRPDPAARPWGSSCSR